MFVLPTALAQCFLLPVWTLFWTATAVVLPWRLPLGTLLDVTLSCSGSGMCVGSFLSLRPFDVGLPALIGHHRDCPLSDRLLRSCRRFAGLVWLHFVHSAPRCLLAIARLRSQFFNMNVLALFSSRCCDIVAIRSSQKSARVCARVQHLRAARWHQ